MKVRDPKNECAWIFSEAARDGRYIGRMMLSVGIHGNDTSSTRIVNKNAVHSGLERPALSQIHRMCQDPDV